MRQMSISDKARQTQRNQSEDEKDAGWVNSSDRLSFGVKLRIGVLRHAVCEVHAAVH